jgi:Zn-dependent peptidase ImmA (M78 family)
LAAAAAEPAYERGARAAAELRLELNLGIEPIADLWTLIKQRGVDLAFHDFGADGPDGLYHWSGTAATVTINKAKQRLRQRFTAAHELGHHELHRPREGGELIVADKDIFARHEEQAVADREQEANAFAGSLLAPDPAIRRYVSKPGAQLQPIDVMELTRTFGVSYLAMVYRLHNSGTILAGDRDRLLRDGQGQYGQLARQIGFNEQLAFPLPTGLPQDYELTAMQIFIDGGIDENRLAELLKTSPEDAVARVQHAGLEPTRPDELSAEEFERFLGA